ncbi:global transactivator [Fusarium albosuccineum]|uniref:Global transactivator n=1 Tax=Fusarium albosuccineum TaxID=1237068 RepID=A0A8H4PES9_9HYPO|nr:global transactivator [Fusarium albosuccineum]
MRRSIITTAIILRSASIALDWGRTTKWPSVNRRATTPEGSESESDAEPDAEPDVEQTVTSVDQEDLMDIERSIYHDEDFKYHADEDDSNWIPGLSTRRIAKRNDGGDPDTSDGRRRGSITEGETSVVRQVQQIRQLYPSEKILGVSSSVMFLHIVKEAMCRRVATNPQFEVTVVDYNGAIRSLDERAEIVRQFNLRYGGPQVLLFSAAAGGTGLNLAGASRVILCEPFWAPGLKQHVIGRAH